MPGLPNETGWYSYKYFSRQQWIGARPDEYSFSQLTDVKKWSIEDVIVKNVTSTIIVASVKELPEIKK